MGTAEFRIDYWISNNLCNLGWCKYLPNDQMPCNGQGKYKIWQPIPDNGDQTCIKSKTGNNKISENAFTDLMSG